MFGREEDKNSVREQVKEMTKEEMFEQMYKVAARAERQAVQQQNTNKAEPKKSESKKPSWLSVTLAFWLHKTTINIIAISGIAFAVVFFSCLFALALERDSVYKTTGESVRFDYELKLVEFPGYDLVLKRREFHDSEQTVSDYIKKKREGIIDDLEWQKKRLQLQKENLGLAKLPDAPGADILGELGMKGPGGH